METNEQTQPEYRSHFVYQALNDTGREYVDYFMNMSDYPYPFLAREQYDRTTEMIHRCIFEPKEQIKDFIKTHITKKHWENMRAFDEF